MGVAPLLLITLPMLLLRMRLQRRLQLRAPRLRCIGFRCLLTCRDKSRLAPFHVASLAATGWLVLVVSSVQCGLAAQH